MLRDIEETPTYQRLVGKGREEGKEEGAVKMREAALEIVRSRFPRLASLAQERLAQIHDLDLLQQAILALAATRRVSEARQYLQSLPEPQIDE